MIEASINQEINEALSSVFGLSEFRPGQREVVDAILAGRDLLAVMPTGAGKSLCYQLPAIVQPGLTLVVSPLIALMKDQVDALRKIEGLRERGIEIAYLASSQTPQERRAVMSKVRTGAVRLLYVSPERLREASFVDQLARLDVWLVAVDEAHCISTWGTDFRPDYLRIPDAIERLPDRPVVAAFTATATPGVREDLTQQLRLDDPQRVLAGFDRPNIRFEVRYTRSAASRLRDLAEVIERRSGSGIIYAGTRKATEEQAARLRENGRTALAYHAGLPPEERSAAQEAFLAGEVDVIVATNAFGLGIDKPDVRFVIHTSLPPSLDAYYQEAGRAGRDGEPADAILLYTRSDRGLQEWLIDQDMPKIADLRGVFGLVARSNGQIDLEQTASGFGGQTTLRVGLQVLAQAGLIEIGERTGAEQSVDPVVERFDRRHVMALEQALAGQRSRRIAQLEEMIAYAEGSGCRREALLDYFGDPDAKPGGTTACCDVCARPEARTAGDVARLTRARKLLNVPKLSKARQRVRDALVEHSSVPGAARALGMEFKEVGALARKMVADGQLDIDDMIPVAMQRGLAGAVEQMDAAGIDYLNPRPGYLQTAMRFCPPGTNWDHLAMYLAHLRRERAIEELGEVDHAELESFARQQRRREGGAKGARASSHTVTQSLEMFLAGHSIDEIAGQRELKPRTVENHLVSAVKAGRVDLSSLVDDRTASVVREAIEQTPPSDTPLRDIRATAERIAGRQVSYFAINVVRAAIGTGYRQQPAADDHEQRGEPDTGGVSDELRELLDRKEKAEELRARHAENDRPWPERWEAEYQRIVERISELSGDHS